MTRLLQDQKDQNSMDETTRLNTGKRTRKAIGRKLFSPYGLGPLVISKVANIETKGFLVYFPFSFLHHSEPSWGHKIRDSVSFHKKRSSFHRHLFKIRQDGVAETGLDYVAGA